MTIAVSAQNFFTKKPTGVEVYTRETVKGLAKICAPEDKIIVYVKNLSKNGENEMTEFLSMQKISFRELKFKRFFNLLGMAFEAHENKFDSVFCPASVVPLFGSKNTTVTVHGLEFKNFPQGHSFLNRLWMNFSTRLSLHLSKKIIVPSLATKNDLIKFYNADPAKIFIVRHSTGLEFKLIESFSRPKNLQQILFLGTLEKRKNPGILVKAFKKIYEKFPEASLIIAGEPGFGADEILDKIKKSSAQSRIFFKGYVKNEEKKNLLFQSGILVLPSQAEGFGFPVLEGQAAECAVICSDIEVLKEVAGDGALYFKNNSSEDLAQKLLDVMINNETRNQLVLNGAKNLERFSWQESAQKTYNLIRNNGKN